MQLCHFAFVIMQIGQTPLHKAAYHGHKDVTKILVDSGAAVDAKSNVNFTSDVYSYQG